jgi:hypothetical protein
LSKKLAINQIRPLKPNYYLFCTDQRSIIILASRPDTRAPTAVRRVSFCGWKNHVGDVAQAEVCWGTMFWSQLQMHLNPI